jgi:anaerobic selenocysteine-containing dehydrogenase
LGEVGEPDERRSMTDRIANPWGDRTPFGPGEEWPARVDLFLEEGVSEEEVDGWVQTASILHSNGDALDIAVKDGRIVGVRGRATDRVNRGRVDPKDLFGWQANRSEDRLKRPLVRENGELVEASWDEAMGRIVGRSKDLLEEKGPLAFGFYTSGQLFLEDYYTLGVIGKAGIGTPHMDGNTRLCTATAAEALKETFGTDGQPGSYADVEHADTIALFGHNASETQAVLWMRMLDRLEGPNPPRLVVVDPRPTPAARRADVHLAVRNGTNMALMNGLLHEIIANGWYADVVLPAATWGEKTGTFTNADRTVNLSEKAVEPPGEARSDLHIFLDYARRMDFRDRDGEPLIKWNDLEGAFEAWKECSRGRPCDRSGITYEMLRGDSGIQWPCNDEHPGGTERLYHELFDEVRQGSLGLLRDLQDLYVMAQFCDITWTMIGQAALGARDRELLEVVETCEGQTAAQIKWLKTRMKQAAPQVLLVAA